MEEKGLLVFWLREEKEDKKEVEEEKWETGEVTVQKEQKMNGNWQEGEMLCVDIKTNSANYL